MIVYYTVISKSDNGNRVEWREVLRCRANKTVYDTAMQLATLYNSKKGLILAGGGSDLHQNTSRPTLYRSEDDGESWTPVFVGDSDMFSLYSFQSLSNGELIGIVPGYLLHSNDTGLTWRREEKEGTGFSMMNDNNGTLLVSKNPNFIYRSEDNGETYEEIQYCKSDCDNLRAITYAGNHTWYMGVGSENIQNGTARVFKSVDNGKTWTQVLELVSSEVDFVVFSVFAYDTEHVLVGTGGGTPSDRAIYQTKNGGQNWTVTAQITDAFDPTLFIVRSFYKSNDGDLFACLDCSYSSSSTWADEPDNNTNSMIVVSYNKGETWTKFSSTGTKRLYWMSETQDGHYIVTTGEYGQILKSK